MHRFTGLLLVLALAGPALVPLGDRPAGGAAGPDRGYPPTRAEDVVEEIHGVPVADPYRWLEDASSDEVQAWMKHQNGFARTELDGLSGREELARRLRQLLYVETASIPERHGDRSFFTRRRADQEKAALYWREGDDGPEQVLLDPNTLAEDGSVSLGDWSPSLDGTTLAYALSRNNADEATLHVMDVASGRVSDIDRIEGAKYAHPSWTPAGDGFYYVWLPSDPSIPVSERPGFAEVRFHALGTDPAHDPLIRERTGNPEQFVWTGLSRDGHWLFYGTTSYVRDEIFYRDMREPGAPWRTLVAGVEAGFTVEAWEDRFYVFTNDGAPRWRVFRVDPAAPDRDDWTEIVPEAGHLLERVSVVGGRLALTYLRDAASEIEIRNLDGEKLRDVALPGIGVSGGLRGNPEDDEAFYSFDSFTTPPEIYRTSIETGVTERWFRTPVPVDPSAYEVTQVFYSSKDGTRVPMFLVQRKELPRDGSTPFILNGYGGFSVNMKPGFRATLYPWLEAGGGFALANLRGGSEYGEEWHRAGMLGNKQNVFDDFIAAAEHLVAEGYTTPSRLGIMGGSNGGLLVGAALTQRPDLFRAAVCSVPLLDMVRYHRFGSGRTWVSEYGSAERKEDFGWLHAYSPYHRVTDGVAYPAVLFASSDSDDRVDPLHARKMAALLQAASTGGPVLLRIEPNAGHGGADLVRSTVELYTDSYAFLFDQLGHGVRP
ncbi:MAG: prolyl oligopeptidase family serine peptidase [Acidimicrobiia bacterium]